MGVNLYGLIGFPLSHSFSVPFFEEKFKKEGYTNHRYQNFPLSSISEFRKLLKDHPNLLGLNVTLPYKEEVIPYLDKLSFVAKEIGAVNTISISSGGLIGYNTDAYGFRKSLTGWIPAHHKLKALILGTGGASKAIRFVLNELDIPYLFVSRTAGEGRKLYDELDEPILDEYKLIINTTPVGMFPNEQKSPSLPFSYLNEKHFLFDLIYNPKKTIFLKQGEAAGASCMNGLSMLKYQAEKSWQIWNQNNSMNNVKS